VTPPEPSGSANYPLDCWYVVATSDEVTHALTTRRALGTSLLLYRQRSGSVAVLEDRCAHRHLPLSLGQLVEDQVVCRYHGFAYDGSGTCVHVPSQENVPYGAAVRSFLVREEGPFVWVWLGNPARGRATVPPSVPWLVDDGWTTFDGKLSVAANYMLLHENALDRTHFAFVHADTSPSGYLEGPPPLQVEVTETSVSYARSFAAAPLASWQVAATGLSPDGRYVQHESGVFMSPALHVDHMQVVDVAGRGYKTVFTRAFTPLDRRTTAVFWCVSRDFAAGDPVADETLRRIHERTMAEDQPLIEAIQAVVDNDGEAAGVSAAADVASVRAHQIVAGLLEEERPRPSGRTGSHRTRTGT
jgi:phenylpropionate dioxygenase-like ring-hydroxylating dioxygenase large terminal subunit